MDGGPCRQGGKASVCEVLVEAGRKDAFDEGCRRVDGSEVCGEGHSRGFAEPQASISDGESGLLPSVVPHVYVADGSESFPQLGVHAVQGLRRFCISRGGAYEIQKFWKPQAVLQEKESCMWLQVSETLGEKCEGGKFVLGDAGRCLRGKGAPRRVT